MASTMIIVPGPERAAYGSPRADSRARDDLRASAISGVRAFDARDADPDPSPASHGYDAERLPRMTYGESRGPLPFLAQQLAQESSATPPAGESDIAPALRFSALSAYGTASESTVEFLSPTPLYDFRV